jgi:hypothetical protein
MLALGSLIVCAIAGCIEDEKRDDENLIRGSGNMVTRMFDHTDFDEVQIGSAFQAEVTYSEVFSIEVKIDDNIEKYLFVEKEGERLKVMLRHDNVSYKDITIEAKITLPDIQGIFIEGAASGELNGFDLDHSVKMYIGGTGSLTSNINTADLEMDVEGASQVTLEGTGGDANITALGASNVDLEEFITGDTDVYADGASSVTVYPSGNLTGSVSGASIIFYVGDPADVDVTVNDVSSVEKKD